MIKATCKPPMQPSEQKTTNKPTIKLYNNNRIEISKMN